jgi:RimJ/RimL family protein N-acetyltransferase
MVRLAPMTEIEYQAYLESDIQRYAEEQVKAGNWHPSEALEKSRKEHQQLLPDGLATKDKYLFSVQDQDTGSKVGVIWFAVDYKRLEPLAFIYDFVIDEEFRRRGYGTRALQALEEKAKELGVTKISLHVFGHNHAAKALYEKVGYETTGVYMAKKVS